MFGVALVSLTEHIVGILIYLANRTSSHVNINKFLEAFIVNVIGED